MAVGIGNLPVNDVSLLLPDGEVRPLAGGVFGIELSADGRYLATTSATPRERRSSLSVIDLQTGRTNEIVLNAMVTAASREWSNDGTRLIVRATWEASSDLVVDPWGPDVDLFVDDAFVGASAICLVDPDTVAAARVYHAYSEESAVNGSIELIDLSTESVARDYGPAVYGHSLVCAPDGSVTFVRVPPRTEVLGEGDNEFVLVVPDHDASADVVRIAADGTQSVIESGDVSITSIR